MSNQPHWFNESNYANFLAESSFLLEVNIPYQKQKFENRKKIAQFDRETAIRRGTLKAQLWRDLYQAKAKGVSMRESVFGEKIQELGDNFLLSLLSEAESKKNPLKANKKNMRPEVDPSDRDRDRKREDRREQKQIGLAAVLIVKNNNIKKIEIILKSDFNPKYHTILRGKTKKVDKGDVTQRDVKHYSGLSNFRNTKTSARLLGKKEEKKTPAKKDKRNTTTKKEDSMPESAPIPAAPTPRSPVDGKEITDASSSFPDWDHNSVQVVVFASDAINSRSGAKPSKEYQELISTSRTFGSAMERFTKEIYSEFPAAASMKFEKTPPFVKTSKIWAKSGIKESSPNAAIIGKGNGDVVGFSIKIGEQIRPCERGDAGIIFTSIINATQPEHITNSFSPFVKDFINSLRKGNSLLNSITPTVQHSEEGLEFLAKEREKQEKIESTKKNILNKACNLVEVYLNENVNLKTSFLLEAFSGNMKFDGKLGAANMLISSKKDGSDTRVISLATNFAYDVAKSRNTHISLKFSQTKNSSNGFLDAIFQKLTSLNEGIFDAVSEIERIKDQLSNPLAFLQMFELRMNDAVFLEPIIYSDFDSGNADRNNTVVFNPGSSSEEEIEIPVHNNYNSGGDSENVIEKGTDALLEEYISLNDSLIELIKDGELTTDTASLIMEKEMFLGERNYRKEYDNYQGSAKQKSNRAKRGKARRVMEKKGLVHKGDGKDVNHKDGNPQNNSTDNLQVMNKSKNRSMHEEYGAGEEGTNELVMRLMKDTPFALCMKKLKKVKK